MAVYDPKERTCLGIGCKKTITSESAGHRFCSDCAAKRRALGRLEQNADASGKTGRRGSSVDKPE